MPDEIDVALKRVTDSVAAFEDNPCMATAADAEWKLSILKILVGIDRFDRLPAFARALDVVSDFIEKNEVQYDSKQNAASRVNLQQPREILTAADDKA